MDQSNGIIKSCFALGATALHFLFGGWSLPMQILVAVVTIDYITGLGAAFVGKRLDSRFFCFGCFSPFVGQRHRHGGTNFTDSHNLVFNR